MSASLDAVRIDILLHGQTTFTEDGNLTLATSSLVRAADQVVVVDPGAWNQRRALEAALARHELTPADVDLVVATHLHWDHFINFEIFTGASLVVAEREWQRVCAGDLDYATPSDTRDILARWPNLLLVQEGQLLPGVHILDTAGHTAGHIAVLLKTAEGPVVLSGDALSHESCVATGLPELVNYSHEQAAESVKKILASASKVIPGHGAPFMSTPRSSVLIDPRMDAPAW